VTYHLNGAKGAEHRGNQVNDWATTILPEHTEWGTKQWQTMQEKKSTVNGRQSTVKIEEANSQEAGVSSSLILTQDSELRTQDSSLQALSLKPLASHPSLCQR
jgi:hypothetical protein